jgi:hypothetical protein
MMKFYKQARREQLDGSAVHLELCFSQLELPKLLHSQDQRFTLN